MSLHTIAVLFSLLGLALTLYCVISAEVFYRKVARHLEQQAAARKGADGEDVKS